MPPKGTNKVYSEPANRTEALTTNLRLHDQALRTLRHSDTSIQIRDRTRELLLLTKSIAIDHVLHYYNPAAESPTVYDLTKLSRGELEVKKEDVGELEALPAEVRAKLLNRIHPVLNGHAV